MQLLLYSCFLVVGLGIPWVFFVQLSEQNNIFLPSPDKKYPKYPTSSVKNCNLVGETQWLYQPKQPALLVSSTQFSVFVLAHHPHTVLMQSYWLTLFPVNLLLEF